MSIFRFQKFEVLNERSAMKVNTDGVLLGTAAHIRNEDRRILDVGTGTGTIALIIAQRMFNLNGADSNADNIEITGIDIDEDSADEAGINFQNSPWSRNIKAEHISLQELDRRIAQSDRVNRNKFDIILSNPPFYDHTLPNPDNRKSMARHTSKAEIEKKEGEPLSYRLLVDFAVNHLNAYGRLALILPADRETELMRYAKSHGLYPTSILRIRSTAKKNISRIIAEFSKTEPETKDGQITLSERTITLQDENGKRTDEYVSLTQDFYL